MPPGLKTMGLEETDMARKAVTHWLAENLYRLESNRRYYALPKRGDKQFRRSPGRARPFFFGKRCRGLVGKAPGQSRIGRNYSVCPKSKEMALTRLFRVMSSNAYPL